MDENLDPGELDPRMLFVDAEVTVRVSFDAFSTNAEAVAGEVYAAVERVALAADWWCLMVDHPHVLDLGPRGMVAGD